MLLSSGGTYLLAPTEAVLRFLLKVEGCGVDAVALTSWSRTIVKHVTQVRIAGGAEHFGTDHEQAAIGFGANVFFFGGCPKARPASTRVKLLVRTEKFGATTDTLVNSGLFIVMIIPGKCPLGPLFTSYMKLLRGQLFFPIFGRLLNLLNHSDILNPQIY